MPDRDELVRRQRELEAVYEEVKTELMQIPGVVGVGLGAKETGGDVTPEFAFRVYVEEKKDRDEVPPEELIPDQIRGFKTDVHTVPTSTISAFVERRDRQKYRPIKGGISIQTQGRSSYGTLGWFARRNADSATVLLTNKHVAYDGTPETTTEALTVGQQSVTKVCCCTCNEIATTVVGIYNTTVDCAIARLNNDIVPSLLITNDVAGTEIHVNGTAAAVALETVRKIGARSAFTTGVVVDVSATTNTRSTDSSGAEVTTTRNNEILVRAAASETYEIENGKPSFSNSGDSGSIVVNSSNQVMGLLYGGSDPANATIHAFVSHISTVLTALSSAGQAITLSNSPGAGGSSDFATATAPVQAVITGTRLDDILVRVLGDAPADDPLVQGVQQHFDEMLHLVNHSRPVTVTWHRNKGPAFLAAFMRSSKEPAYRIPLEIDGVSRQQAVTAMVAVLQEHGSESLRAALDRYSLEVMLACSRGDTIEEIIRSLHEARSPHLVAETSPL